MTRLSGPPENDELSVSVARLLSQHGSHPAGTTEPGQGARLGRRDRRITMITAIVLCGALVTAAVAIGAMLGGPTRRPEPTAATGPIRITGATAVRPERISTILHLLDNTASWRAIPGEDQSGESEDAELTAPEGFEIQEPVPEPVTDPVLRPVTRFYRLVGSEPADAFDLLGRRLRGSGYPEFESAWAGVVQVQVSGVAKVAPRAAVIAVRLKRAGGSSLHTLQRMVVGPNGRIQEASLLTATVDDQ